MSSVRVCEPSCSVYGSECGRSLVSGAVYAGQYQEPTPYEMGNFDYIQESAMPNYEANVPVSGGGDGGGGLENALPPYTHGSLEGSPSAMEPIYGAYPSHGQQPFMPLDAYHNTYMDQRLNSHPGRNFILGPNGKPKRKRVATIAQRRAANIRERKRMFNLNEAFDELRTRVPTFAYEKRLSRIETLRLAITYISFMADVVEGKDPKDVKLTSLKGAHWIPLKKTSEENENHSSSPLTGAT